MYAEHQLLDVLFIMPEVGVLDCASCHTDANPPCHECAKAEAAPGAVTKSRDLIERTSSVEGQPLTSPCVPDAFSYPVAL